MNDRQKGMRIRVRATSCNNCASEQLSAANEDRSQALSIIALSHYPIFAK